MTANKKSAVIAGASGLIGTYLTRYLSANDEYQKVSVLVRKEGFLKKLGLTEDSGLSEVVIDYNSISLVNIEADVAFCALGTTMKKAGSKEAFYKVDHDYVLDFARMCKENNTKEFLVVSSMGVNAESSNYYLKVKGTMEKDLEAVEFEQLKIFRPSLLVGPRDEFRRGEKFGEKVIGFFRPILRGSLKKWIPVHASQVAKAMISAVEKDAGEKVIESNAIREFEAEK